MRDNNCPCNGCTERFAACSDRCPKDERGEYGYAAWSADDKAEKAKKNEMRRQWKEDVRRDRRYEFVTTKRRY